MRMPSAKQRKSLERATRVYQDSLPLAKTFLVSRGISYETAQKWRLGVVHFPELGHEAMTGRLSIPYLNRLGVIALKFRCLQGHECKAEGCSKYLSTPGQDVYVFNVLSTEACHHTIHVTEGEIDAIVLAEVLGEPCVGIPGTSSWRAHHPWHFKGWQRVVVWPDGDKAGKDFGNLIRKEVSAAEVINLPAGHDVNSLYLQAGAEAIRQLAGAEDTEDSTNE